MNIAKAVLDIENPDTNLSQGTLMKLSGSSLSQVVNVGRFSKLEGHRLYVNRNGQRVLLQRTLALGQGGKQQR